MGNIVKENSVFLFGNTIFENGAVGFIITYIKGFDETEGENE